MTPQDVKRKREVALSQDIVSNMVWIDLQLSIGRLSVIIPISDLVCNDLTAFSMRIAKIYSDLGWNVSYEVQTMCIIFDFSESEIRTVGCECGSTRLMSVDTRITISSTFSIDTFKYTGYPPDDMGINQQRPNRLQFVYCLDCGKIQGNFPLPKTLIEQGKER